MVKIISEFKQLYQRIISYKCLGLDIFNVDYYHRWMSYLKLKEIPSFPPVECQSWKLICSYNLIGLVSKDLVSRRLDWLMTDKI